MVEEDNQSYSLGVNTRASTSMDNGVVDNGTGVESEIVDADQSIVEPFDPKMIRV